MKNIIGNKKLIWAGAVLLILVLAVIRYYYEITDDTFSFLDEYISFDVSAGFFHTGKFYPWDFHHQTLLDQHYTRAALHTILLSIWYRIFGLSVISGKTLSAFIGVICVLSLFYMTGRIFKSPFISMLTCVFFMGNPDVTMVFRQIRMYSLWMLLMIWASYMVFRAVTCIPRGKRTLFGFSIPYALASVLLLAASYSVHINTMAILPGIAIFFFYCFFVKREKRYADIIKYVLGGGIIFIIFCKFLALFSFVVAEAIGDVVSHIEVLEEPNTMYGEWLAGSLGNHRLFIICCGAFFLAFVLSFIIRSSRLPQMDKNKDDVDFPAYCLLIIASSLILFIYLADRYYQYRYMVYVYPLMCICAAWGIIRCGEYAVSVIPGKTLLPFVVSALITLICSFTTLKVMRADYFDVYASSHIPRHLAVYMTIKNDLGARTGMVPMAGFDIRDYYAVQVFPEYETMEFERDGSDMARLEAFMEKYPTGYITVETSKMRGMDQEIKAFMANARQVTGEGLDNYAITTVSYGDR